MPLLVALGCWCALVPGWCAALVLSAIALDTACSGLWEHDCECTALHLRTLRVVRAVSDEEAHHHLWLVTACLQKQPRMFAVVMCECAVQEASFTVMLTSG